MARDVHAWDRLPSAVASPGAVDLETGVSQMGACACGVLLPGQGDQHVLHVLPDLNPCITAGAGAQGLGLGGAATPSRPEFC